MRFISKLLLLSLVALLHSAVRAQDLAPRAYVILPVSSNAVTLTWSYFNGGLNFNGAVPVTGATGTFSVPTFTYYHSFSFFRRSANITASLPYGVGQGIFFPSVIEPIESAGKHRVVFRLLPTHRGAEEPVRACLGLAQVRDIRFTKGIGSFWKFVTESGGESSLDP